MKTNFKFLENGKFTNEGGCNYGCCMHCQYLSDGENWKACNESCIRINYGSCKKCEHNNIKF